MRIFAFGIMILATGAGLMACGDAAPVAVLPTGPTAPASAVQPAAGSDSASRSSPSHEPLLLFSRVFEDFSGNLSRLEGFSFASPFDNDQRAFVHTANDSQIPFASQVFVPMLNGQVCYVDQSVSSGGSELMIFHLTDSSVQDVAPLPGKQIIQFDVGSDGSLAWVEANAKAWLAGTALSGPPLQVGPAEFSATQIRFFLTRSGVQALLVTGTLGVRPTTLVYARSALNQKPQLLASLAGTGAAPSPDGSQIAFVASGDATLKLYELGNQSTTTLPTSGETSFGDLAWYAQGTLVYRSLDLSGEIALRSLDTRQNIPGRITSLNLPASELSQLGTSGIICPTADTSGTNSTTPSSPLSALYFADRRDGHFQILVAKPDGNGNWSVSSFARSDDDLTSLICPRLATESESIL